MNQPENIKEEGAPQEPTEKVAKKPAKKAAKKPAKKAAKKPAKKAAGKASKAKRKKKAGAKSGARRGKPLVIVESPAKAKTINRYLGDGYIVKASVGHVRDLPKSKLGIDVDKDFEPQYLTIRGKKDIIKELKSAADKAKTVYLAPDPDREGEAIAWHLKEALGLDDERAKRVTFNEITKKAIQHAFEHPREIAENLVNAQQARRMLDRLVGYKLSPLLWKKVFRGLSAGRVQSVALRLIVEREREIMAFTPEEYWTVTAFLGKQRLDEQGQEALAKFLAAYHGVSREEEATEKPEGEVEEEDDSAEPEAAAPVEKPRLPEGVFHADLKQYKGGKPALASQADVDALLADIRGKPFTVSKIEKKERRDRPRPPFITSTLQQAASTRLGFGARKTMQLAQRLYEGIEIGEDGPTGLITYMRTDSFHLSDFAVTDAREMIQREFGERYLPEKGNFFKSSKRAQAAHEAIRPTSVARTPDAVARFLDRDQLRLYTLIWERFVACQMNPAVYEVTTIDITAGDALFRTSGKRLLFDGHARITGVKLDKDEQLMPKLDEGEKLTDHRVQPDQHFTQPPPRYTEASLVKTLEKEGIGRPSTYASIIGTIQDRFYVRSDKRRLFATELGMLVNDMLVGNFQRIMQTDFTSKMEAQLDKIEDGELEWVEVLRNFYAIFAEELAEAEQKIEKVKGKLALDEEGKPLPCPICGSEMMERWSRFGKFYGCTKFPECKGTVPLNRDGKILRVKKEDLECPECGKEMVVRMSRRGPFLGCSTFPACRGTRSLESEKSLRQLKTEAEFAGLSCDQCGKPMNVKFFRGRPFIGCSGYPDCKNTYNPTKAREAIEAGTLKRDEQKVKEAEERYERIKAEREAEEQADKERATGKAGAEESSDEPSEEYA
ncbi:MAG: type I DNA topoisomerase [Planctomycetes bacterium]|nr:type I DNA topoisomerase [Planctomycetota bacterium]MCB9934300.1 type I DNA topoisomerase [Planctomycetota bacterium]